MALLSLAPSLQPKWFSDLQGNILKGHGRDHTLHLLLSFTADDPKKTRDRIQGFSQLYVTPMDRQLIESEQFKKFGIPGRLFVNFLLSRSGYEKLGFSGAEIPTDPAFLRGMTSAETQSKLADPAPSQWEPGLGAQPIDAMIILADDDPEFLGREARQMLSIYFDGVATLTAAEKGFAIRNKRDETVEHFGYVDGRSQPIFFQEELATEKKAGGIANWDPSASTDLVLVKDPNSGTDVPLGSYFVFRKLEQNVREFKRTEREKLASAQKFTGDEVELAGAMAVGRFEDGTPVTLQKGDGVDDPVLNNFNYKDDSGGSKCPFHSHIRKVNPRNVPDSANDEPFNPTAERSRRIARRGITYGGPRTQESFETNDFDTLPSGDVGLLFMCFQSNIAEQFEFMQSTWANNAGFPSAGVGIDPVIGQEAAVPTPPNPPSLPQSWPTEWGDEDFATHPKAKFSFGGFVTMKGGEYFFAPSLPFLTSIVSPPKPPTPPVDPVPPEPITKPYGG